MNIRTVIAATVAFILFSGCTKTFETEFGQSCTIQGFAMQKKLFSSDVDGSVKFLLDESMDKKSGKVLTGSFSGVFDGTTSWTADPESVVENCKNCMFLFVRQSNGTELSYTAESAEIDLDKLYYDTKGRVSFMRGSFRRMVFKNIENEECTVIEKVDFVFY
ncbi:MAG TPA: hypothetical protein PKG52_06200 [bacterium]|nr:hypothetical protein [bacterium]HPS28621.1 hypothetical protein [bacterium]